MTQIAEVCLPLNLDKLYSYSIPDNIEYELIGKRVIVQLKSKILSGLVVSIKKDNPDYKLKPIIDVLDKEPVVDEKFINFMSWIADYYLSTMSDVLNSAFPPLSFPKEDMYIESANLDENVLNEFARKKKRNSKLIKALQNADEPISKKELKEKHNAYFTTLEYIDLRNKGIINITYIRDNEYKPKTFKAVKPVESNLNDEYINEIRNKYLSNAKKQSEAFDIVCNHFIAKGKPITLLKLSNEFDISSGIIYSLIDKNLLEKVDKQVDRVGFDTADLSQKVELNLKLSNEQKLVLDGIRNDIKTKDNKVFIHGITGSGKTLVYMHLINDVLKKGMQTILLLPEISLTPQILDRFIKSFPGKVCTIHSKMNDFERYEVWEKIKDNKFDIVIGPRSAIFAPVKKLGLVIVDEEHDGSYKQDSKNPRYNARDIALVRANLEQCPVVMGSATPSMETYYNCIQGKYKKYELLNRADSHGIPNIKIIDMLNATRVGGNLGTLSLTMVKAINQCIKNDQKIILFQNRRGYSSYIQCMECGYIPKCENCEVTLTYHSSDNKMMCHYCGHTEPIVEKCHDCGKSSIRKVGIGTQKLEEEIKESFPDIKFMRYDSDTTGKKNTQRKILKDFNVGNTKLLIGTQMLSKGIDIPDIGLVGIVNADADLFTNDIRSAEKTYQLINQVAGRAGRGQFSKSQVIIQSYTPNHPAIQSVNSILNKTFIDKELENRKSLNYPPYCRLIKVEFSSENIKLVEKCANAFYDILPQDKGFLDILPVTEPLINKVRGKHRRIIIIRNDKTADKNGSKARNIFKVASKYFEENYLSGDLKYFIDIDVSSIM